MLYIENILCITTDELLRTDNGEPVMTKVCYDHLVNRKKIISVRKGIGRGNKACISVNSLPDKYKERVYAKYGKGDKEMLERMYEMAYRRNDEAAAWCASYMTDNGTLLDAKQIAECTANASAIDALLRLMEDANRLRIASRDKKLRWDELQGAASYYCTRHGAKLPDSASRLRDKVNAYRRDGYASLLSGKYGNQSARKVDARVERLVLMLAVRQNQPFAAQVWEDYNAFIRGEIEVIDSDSGEIFNPDDFVKNGKPLRLGKRTIDGIMTKPANALLINSRRKSGITLLHEDLPYNRRKTGMYSLSKVTADDRDLPRVERGTKVRPKAYYMYDVLSGCVIGRAYSRTKDIELVTEMFRDAFLFLQRNGLGIPAQIEVENHLMTQWKDGFLRAGEIFDFVRFCAPQNSQEKHAEALNGAKKRLVEHRQQAGIGRWYAKYGAYRTESKKVSDAGNDTWEERKYYTWEELISDDLRAIDTWNNLPHSDQRRFPGKTRMEVLLENVNPSLKPINPAVIARYIGKAVETSVRRGACRVAYHDYRCTPDMLARLVAGRKNITAYYLPDGERIAQEIYAFQGNKYIGKMPLIEVYNEFQAERTADDWKIMQQQAAARGAYEAYIAKNIPTAAVVVSAEQRRAEEKARAEAEVVEVADMVDEQATGGQLMAIDAIAAKGRTDI